MSGTGYRLPARQIVLRKQNCGEELKAAVCRQVDAMADELVAVSHAVHRFAEPAFAEHQSAALLAGAAKRYGLRVGHAPGGLQTAFVADAGTAGPVVAIFGEYDALPGLGHACGHNIIAATALGAAVALSGLGDRMTGRVRLIGSPAEEGGGGKVLLARAGVLRDVHAALLVHPNAFETARPNIVAALQLDVHTLGRAAHASLFPECGINALDAMLLGFAGISAIRPGLPEGGQVHGVLLRGGTAPGIVPDRAQARFIARAPTLRTLRPVAARVLGALRSGALAVGAELRVRALGPAYAELRTDPALATAWERNAAALGRQLLGTVAARRTGSSDLGNISHLVPAIHPMIAISDGAVVPHTRAFAAAAVSPRGDRAVLDGAKALAMTAVDIWCNASVAPTPHNWR